MNQDLTLRSQYLTSYVPFWVSGVAEVGKVPSTDFEVFQQYANWHDRLSRKVFPLFGEPWSAPLLDPLRMLVDGAYLSADPHASKVWQRMAVLRNTDTVFLALEGLGRKLVELSVTHRVLASWAKHSRNLDHYLWGPEQGWENTHSTLKIAVASASGAFSSPLPIKP